MSAPAATGTQYELSLGQAHAEITQVAAGIRHLSVGGVDLVEPFGPHEVSPMCNGITLVPWPNRVAGGRWMLEGEEQQLDITEPERGAALHGLLRDRPYDLVEHTEDSVALAATIFPTRGYPFVVDVTVRYRLVPDGLEVDYELSNPGTSRAPVAIGAHPYLRLGSVPIDDLVLTVPAGTRFETDAVLTPVREAPVAGTEFDLRGGRRVSELTLDDGFGAVEFSGDIAASRLTAPDGRFVELWQPREFGYVQVFTTHIFPRPDGLHRAIAVEPMTAPPDALNTGQSLHWLEPGERWSIGWGIRYSG
jgi:aldose 1-epimerase